MSEQTTQPDMLDLDEVSRFTQEKRLSLIKALSNNINNEDPKVMSVYAKLLDGMDKVVTTKRRLGIDEAAQQSAEENARSTAEILKAVHSNMFQNTQNTQNNTPRAIPELPKDLPDPELVPGETAVGLSTLTYDNFKTGQVAGGTPAT